MKDTRFTRKFKSEKFQIDEVRIHEITTSRNKAEKKAEKEANSPKK